ncbi:uncharacterized protein STEHIDRAFT_122125, partial [Stereum hirsutum FP-91666 SS1]|uniref:uncharacterized protein n=1 Tax=Stereum hirsutum (strain FP-91666) TaxID=721885 RepID=UPI000444959A
MDITPCTRAIEDILKLDSDCPPSVWGNLVRAGYIDRLCECVAGLRDALNYTSPAEERIAGTEPARHTFYHWSLTLLFDATNRIRKPLTPTDLVVIATLRKHWPSITRRLWNDPQGTIDPRKCLDPNRVVVQGIAIQAGTMDASFFETMRSDGDLTLCLSVRYWMYSTSGNAVQLLRLLTDLIYPEHVRNAEEANAEGVRILFRAVKKGAGSFRNFIAKLESAFAQFQGRDAQEPILLLHNYLDYAMYYTPRPDGNDAAEPSFLRTVTKSVTLWRSLFLLLNRATPDRAVWDTGEAGTVYERVL